MAASVTRSNRRRQTSSGGNAPFYSNPEKGGIGNNSSTSANSKQSYGPSSSRASTSTSAASSQSALFQQIPFTLPVSRQRIHLPVPTVIANALSLSTTATPRRRMSTLSGRSGHMPFANKAPSSGWRKRWLLLLTTLLLLVIGILRIRSSRSKRNQISNEEPSTLVLQPFHINRIWAFEILSGHYPSQRKIPSSISLAADQFGPINNPGLPRNLPPIVYQSNIGTGDSPATSNRRTTVSATGPIRTYLNMSEAPVDPSSLFPPRPIPRSAIDMDMVMLYCDFSLQRYVRDCLEMLRLGAQLDRSTRVRRGVADHWRHLFIEEGEEKASLSPKRTIQVTDSYAPQDVMASLGYVSDRDPHRQGALHLQQAPVRRSIEPVPLQVTERVNRAGSGPTRRPHPTHPTADPTCDPDFPRIAHILWAGPFTDKPYLAITSFLFTQNLGLHLDIPHDPHEFHKPLDPKESPREEFLSEVCRPQMWIWINPGPAASIPNPAAESQMFAQLRANPWSSPFLHPRFAEVIKFKLWNTTEQLDGIPELRDSWRDLPLFNSGGVKFGNAPQEAATEEGDDLVKENTSIEVAEVEQMPADKRAQLRLDEEYGRFGDVDAGEEALAKDRSAQLPVLTGTQTIDTNATEPVAAAATASPTGNSEKDDADELFDRIGSTSSQGYDRLTVVLSDMARFVLCHRFGGVYLDADTLLLRDWEEIWGWHGAFAYRWSRLEKYNTAVLKLHRGSALGSFLFKTALANGLDFHPMTISRYTKDAGLEDLLLRLPDALFDPAWLNTEYYQRDRPPFPYFRRFEDFFDPPKESNAAPLAVGFDGFFKGAFSYHFHNFWWIPFDPARNWPDLGLRFAAGELKARTKARAQAAAEAAAKATQQNNGGEQSKSRVTAMDQVHDTIEDDERDLSWATVLKRTFEAYLRGERPNMYGDVISWIEEK